VHQKASENHQGIFQEPERTFLNSDELHPAKIPTNRKTSNAILSLVAGEMKILLLDHFLFFGRGCGSTRKKYQPIRLLSSNPS